MIRPRNSDHGALDCGGTSYPGCVSYGTQGCIPPPCSTTASGCNTPPPPGAPYGGGGGGGGGKGAAAAAPKNVAPSKTQQVLNAIFNKPWALSWIIPVVGAPVVAGLGPAGDLEWDPNSHTACAGIGIGASAGHNAAVGPLTNGKTFTGQTYQSGAKDILAGWSLSGGYNTPALIGVQGMINGSGAAWGPSVGVPGVS